MDDVYENPEAHGAAGAAEAKAVMGHDLKQGVSISFEKIFNRKKDLDTVNYVIKKMENNESDQYLQLKAAKKDLTKQMKALQDEYLLRLNDDPEYRRARKNRMEIEEDLAHARENFAKFISKLSPEHRRVQVNVNGFGLTIDITPELKVYVNGKEEKL